jgi:hypothetical protein
MKEIAKNLLEDKTCQKCKHSMNDECWLHARRPRKIKENTCRRWKRQNL